LHRGFCAHFKDRWVYRGLLFAATVDGVTVAKATATGKFPTGRTFLMSCLDGNKIFFLRVMSSDTFDAVVMSELNQMVAVKDATAYAIAWVPSN
jgi:hypothetical protein